MQQCLGYSKRGVTETFHHVIVLLILNEFLLLVFVRVRVLLTSRLIVDSKFRRIL